MVDMGVDFYCPAADTENPFCKLRWKYYLDSLPPKVRGTIVLGLAFFVVLIVVSADVMDTTLDSVQDNDALHDSFYVGFMVAIVTTATLTFSMLPCTVLAYQKKVMDLRVGRPSFHADHAIYEAYHSVCFYGAYSSYLALGWILSMIIVFLVAWSLAYEETRNSIWWPILKWFIFWLVSYILDLLWLRTYLINDFCCLPDHKYWLRNPPLFFVVDAVLTAYYLPQQTMTALYRIIYLICFAIISCFRVDVDMMPHGGETYDTGFSSFTAVMLMHERQRNPVVLSFVESLALPGATPRVSQRALVRWKLALLLIKNPSLKRYRRYKRDEPASVAKVENPLKDQSWFKPQGPEQTGLSTRLSMSENPKDDVTPSSVVAESTVDRTVRM
eukprot:TRINITY_DN2826_c0_g1_i1.p1 TRINITY_DN2826_c0_g1~~TRINITY_DN2826_c0_g1_i1.p1  ORF type:complete len:386 (+),score=86.40 TRINITY_DN2826_c0_g1_i1:248-1405(+)